MNTPTNLPERRPGSWRRRRFPRLARAWALVLLPALQFPLAAAIPDGGGFALTGHAAGGGGLSTGGSYALVGAVILPTGTVSTGGGYSLSAGLGGSPASGTGPVRLRANVTPAKDALLAWDGDAEEYVLEFSPVLGPDANWQPVVPQPTGNTFLTPCAQPARFFRLRRVGP